MGLCCFQTCSYQPRCREPPGTLLLCTWASVPAELISGELNSGRMCPFTLPSTMWKEPLPTASPPPSSSLCQSDGEKMYLSVAVICSSLIMCEAFKNHSHFLFYDYLFLPFAQSYWLVDHSTVPLTTPHPQHPYLD